MGFRYRGPSLRLYEAGKAYNRGDDVPFDSDTVRRLEHRGYRFDVVAEAPKAPPPAARPGRPAVAVEATAETEGPSVAGAQGAPAEGRRRARRGL
jgi:hypothetical protein